MNPSRIAGMRQAVAAADWPRAMRLWEAYAAEIRAEIACHACTRSRLNEARDFLVWAKRTVRCARAQAQARLDAMHAARRYATPRPHSSWRASG